MPQREYTFSSLVLNQHQESTLLRWLKGSMLGVKLKIGEDGSIGVDFSGALCNSPLLD